MNIIFKYFTLQDDPDTKARIVWFAGSFAARDFRGIEKIAYLYIEFCARLGIIAKREYLNAFLRTDCKRLVLENNIKLDNMNQYDYTDPAALEEATRVISAAMIQFYDSAVQQDVDAMEFKVAMNTWMQSQTSSLLRQAMTTNFPRVTQGESVYDVVADLEADLHNIKTTYSEEKLDELDFLANKYSSSKKSGGMEFISQTHIPCIDGDVGGIFKQMIVTFTGLAGSGKSRFIYRCYAYVAAVFFHIDVRIDSLELDAKQVENILIAIHISALYQIKIPDSLMNKNDLDETQLTYYYGAKEDLFNNKENKYGHIYINDKPMYIEQFRPEAMRFLRLHKDTKIWIIDYAGLMRSNPQGYGAKRYSSKYEIIEDLYADARWISTVTGVAWVIINQFNKTGADKAKAGKIIDQGDIEGGQTVHKYTDYNMYTTQTEEQKVVQSFLMTADKVRGAKGFSKVPFKNDLAISKFEQQKKVTTT